MITEILVSLGLIAAPISDRDLKEGARLVWSGAEGCKVEGWTFEFDQQWNWSQHTKAHNHVLWEMTIFPSLERRAADFVRRHGSPPNPPSLVTFTSSGGMSANEEEAQRRALILNAGLPYQPACD